MNTAEFRNECAQKIQAASASIGGMSAFVGLDGFVDEIIHVVDKRHSVNSFERLPTIARLAERLAGAAGKSTNLELVTQLTKLGGNGPIMANALASFGVQVTYLGALGYPNLHPIFNEFAKRAEVHTIAEPGHTDALEFEDGKIMMGKHYPLGDVTWPNIQARFGREKFVAKFNSANLVGFVNWTMIPFMSDVWESVLKDVCPGLSGERRYLFFDLADPEKRTKTDILRALDLIMKFEKHFKVILGLNEKEAYELAKVLDIPDGPTTPEGLSALTLELNARLKLGSIVVHPVTYALTVSDGQCHLVEGPFVDKPLITTGAGDHFNSGFCFGKLLGLPPAMCVLTGVATSGFYVRSAKSPTASDLIQMIHHWPVRK